MIDHQSSPPSIATPTTERRKQVVRQRILHAASELFTAHGLAATTVGDICTHANVANRTFFNHFPTRHDMIRTLAQTRLAELQQAVSDQRSDQPVSVRLVGVFDDIATELSASADRARQTTNELLVGAGLDAAWRSELYGTFLGLVTDGVARGELDPSCDVRLCADAIVGPLLVGILNCTMSPTYPIERELHSLAVALADFITCGVPSTTTSGATRKAERPQVVV